MWLDLLMARWLNPTQLGVSLSSQHTHLRGDTAWCLAGTYEASDQTEYASCVLAALMGPKIGTQATCAAALRCRTCTLVQICTSIMQMSSAASGDTSSIV